MKKESYLERHNVFRSDRIKVTEYILMGEISGRRILEIGAGDYSFDYITGSNLWIKADFSAPCDIMCDINNRSLKLPFKSQSFDFIICTEVLEHLLWPQQLLATYLSSLEVRPTKRGTLDW